MPSTDIIRKIERTHIFSDEIIFSSLLGEEPFDDILPRPSVRDIIKRLSEEYYF